MKNIKNYIIFTKVVFDTIIVFISFFIAKQIRLITDLIPNVQLPIQTIHNKDLFIYSILGTLLVILLFSIHGIYRFNIKNKITEYSKITLYIFYSFLFFSVFVYLSQGFIFKTEIPRLIIGFSFLISFALIILQRALLSIIEKKFGKKRKVIIFSNNSGDYLYELIKDFKKSIDYKIIGVANNYKIGIIGIKEYNFNDIIKKIKNRNIDDILFISSDLSKEDENKLKKYCDIFGIKYKIQINGNYVEKTQITLMNSIPVLEIINTSLSGWNSILKRIFDIFSSIIGIIIFLPIYIIISILIKIEDPSGPIIFKNRRVGKNGKEFDLYKFRYMKWEFCTKESYSVSDEEKQKALNYEKELIEKKSTRNGPLYKIKNDPRKTKIGTFIEKYSIDELPQFFNVLLGNMSLVGPRPHQPREVEKYDIEQIKLLTIKPGITGMAQVNGRETNTFNDEAQLDLYYIENWSLLLDLKIIAKTFFSVLKRK